MLFWQFCYIFKNIFVMEKTLVIASENPCTCQICKNYLERAGFIVIFLQNTAWKVYLFGVFLVRIFLHADCIRRDTEYFSVFSPNMGKCEPEKLQKRRLFMQWKPLCYSWNILESFYFSYCCLKLNIPLVFTFYIYYMDFRSSALLILQNWYLVFFLLSFVLLTITNN